jgi:hypothetical protein
MDDGAAVVDEGCNCPGFDFADCGITRLGTLPEVGAGLFAAKPMPPVMRKISPIRTMPLMI